VLIPDMRRPFAVNKNSAAPDVASDAAADDKLIGMNDAVDAQRLAERSRPPGPMVGWMRWEHLLFLHWKWNASEVQRSLPRGLTVDTFEGAAWLGVVPFFMRNVRPAFLPAVPGLSNFLELNVRTYVIDAQGRSGIWFYSLDCNQWLAVKTARALFHLKYEHAAMQASINRVGEVDYRTQRRGATSVSHIVYQAAPETTKAAPGSLEFFLIERYRLFSHDAQRDRLFTARVWHEPYDIGAVRVTQFDAEMLRLDGFDPQERAPDHICAAAPVNVRVFPRQEVRAVSV
jgi:hypothetical protein